MSGGNSKSTLSIVGIIVVVALGIVRITMRMNRNDNSHSNIADYRHRMIMQQQAATSGFQKYLEKIPMLERGYVAASYEELQTHTLNDENLPYGASVLGKLMPVKNHYFVIHTYSADIQLPILEVFDRNGQKIDHHRLFDLNHCNHEQLNHHSRFTVVGYDEIILENLKITGSDTVVVQKRTLSTVDIIENLEELGFAY